MMYRHVTIEETRHGRKIVYFRKAQGPRVRLPDDITSPEFRVAYAAALAGNPIPHVRDMPVTAIEKRKQRTEAVLRGAVRSAKTRATQKDVPFDLSLDYVLDLAAEQGFRCALTGIEFFAGNEARGRIDPFTPSIDRAVPSLGYVPGNVRIVVYAVNAMLLDWGEGVFVQIANSYRYWQRTKTDHSTPAPMNGERPAPVIKSRA